MKLGRIKGILINVHVSTLIIVLLVGYSVAIDYYILSGGTASLLELLIVGLVNGFAILASILVHELMHSLVALRYGLGIHEIELYLFGGVSKIDEEPKSPSSEVTISIVGPLSSILIGIVFYLFFTFITTGILAVDLTIYYVGWSNLILGLFNLVPAFPMDGGRLLRALLWKRRKDHISATKTAAHIGQGFGYLLMIFGFADLFFLGGLFNGIWYIILGMFLNSAAKQSYISVVYESQLSKFKAGELMREFTEFITAETPLDKALKEFFIKYKTSFFPVVKEGNVIGIVHISDVIRIPITSRAAYPVTKVMRNINDFLSISPQSTGMDVMKLLTSNQTKPPLVIVKKDDRILGYIGQDELDYVLKMV